MKKLKFAPFEDAADREAITASIKGKLVPLPPEEEAELKAVLREAAINYRKKKEARINIRLPEIDLAGLKAKAEEEGMPYQTLIASVLHKFVNGRLKADTSSTRKNTK